MNIKDQLVYMTAKIEVATPIGVGSGTGFYYRFCENAGGSYFPAIITNKHVVKDAVEIAFCIHLADAKGDPVDGAFERVGFKSGQIPIIHHPDPLIDLCAIPVGPIKAILESQGKKTYTVDLNKAAVASPQLLGDITPLEDVVMIGYPNGIWDSSNNMPIIRSGVTATHPKRMYNGKREFLIDIAAFPGSSGSPVFLFNCGSYLDKNNNLCMGNRTALLGVLYAGMQNQVSGEIKIINIPLGQVPVALSLMPNNLGIVVSASQIDGLEVEVAKFVAALPKQ